MRLQTEEDIRSAVSSKPASQSGSRSKEQQLKSKTLKLYRQLDESNSGLLKQNVFFSLLNCIGNESNGQCLSHQDEQLVIEKHGEQATDGSGMMIKYADAINNLKCDPIRDEWTYGQSGIKSHNPGNS